MVEAKFEDLQIVEINGRDALTWRQFHANTGESHRGHKHTIDHVTLLVSGELSVKYTDQLEQCYKAPASIYINRDVEHTLTAQVDNTSWLCTFLIPVGGDARSLSLES